MSEDCTVLNISCLQADLQDVFLNPHLFAVTQVYHNITWAATQATRIFLKFNHAFFGDLGKQAYILFKPNTRSNKANFFSLWSTINIYNLVPKETV